MTYLEALKLYPYDYNERKTFLKNKFNLLISRMKLFIKTDELNINKESMTYVFEHIKNDIIKIIAVFVPTDDKFFLESNNWNDIKYRKKVFDALVELENKPLLIWFFFHFNLSSLGNLKAISSSFISLFFAISFNPPNAAQKTQKRGKWLPDQFYFYFFII